MPFGQVSLDSAWSQLAVSCTDLVRELVEAACGRFMAKGLDARTGHLADATDHEDLERRIRAIDQQAYVATTHWPSL